MNRGKSITLALCAAALAVALIVIFSRSSSEEEDEELTTEVEDTPPAREPSAARTLEQAPPAADEAASDAPAAPAAQAAPPEEPSPEPLTPEVVDHARLMAIPTTAMAIERRDVKHLHQFLQFIKEHSEDKIVSETDIGAVEAAIACIEHAPDATEEAEDFLRFGARTGLADSLRKVCNAR